jgi:hypothetical protein
MSIVPCPAILTGHAPTRSASQGAVPPIRLHQLLLMQPEVKLFSGRLYAGSVTTRTFLLVFEIDGRVSGKETISMAVEGRRGSMVQV